MNVSGLPCCVDQKTAFRPKKRKHHPSGSNVSGLRISDHVVEKPSTATLVSYNLREAVKLPYGEDINEWLAIHTIDFYNQVNVLYATLKEFCTTTTCPIMNAGSFEYRWGDGIAIKPISVSAPEYVEYLMNWIVIMIDNETIFPKKPEATFPPNFKDLVKVILKRLFRVYAHIYHCHFQKVVNLKEEAHLNTCFKHLVLFISEYQLIDEAEMEPLKVLVGKILEQ
ncbi:MOB kinase activator-like 2A [Hirschfeldia incana]|nr:MOB kinase activator-like 2A [Hirschfeldia incana]